MDNLSNITSLVTGSTGFIGSHLVDFLVKKNHNVKCIVRKSSNLKWLEKKPIEIIDSGLTDKEKLKESLKNVDYVFHIAGIVKAKTWEDYVTGNVLNTKVILDAILESDSKIKKVIILSSQTAGGPSVPGIPIKETDKPNPITRYGKSKLEQEKLALQYSDKIPITIIRPPAVYGPRDTEIYLVFKTYGQGLMTMVGLNKKLLSIVHVFDLVEGIFNAAITENTTGKLYYVGSENYYDWDLISEAISKAMGKKAIKIKIPHFVVFAVAGIAQFFSLFSKHAATFNIEKAKDFVQADWTCDSNKAKKDFGYKQKISLEEGMKITINWYKENGWL